MTVIPCKLIVLTIIGIILVISGIASYYFSQNIIKQNVHKNVVIAPNSTGFKYWSNPPANIYRKYYLFDVGNPLEVENGTGKPYLLQRGPYTYKEKWEKKNIQFLGNNMISYYPVTTMHFVPELSNGNENDSITFLNVPALAMIEFSQKMSPEIQDLVNLLLKLYDTKLFQTKTVKELISGYQDPLLKLAHRFFPNIIKSDTFSLNNGQNGTEFENFTMLSGADDLSNVARLVSWNGLEKLDFWNSTYANLINGTDATMYPPFRTRDQVLYAYNAQMCRSFHMVYLKDNKIKDFKVYDFHLPSNIFANSTINPNNDGFCYGPCLGNGVLNISKCYGGASGFISQPHFLNADTKFIDAVYGIKPDANIHDLIIQFEPTTGVPINGNIRLQINFYLPKVEKIDLVKRIVPTLLPIIWFDNALQINDDTLKQLKTVANLVNLVNIIFYVLISIGSSIFVLATVLITYRLYQSIKSNHEPINSTNENNSVDETTRLLNN